jgi:hypothetical protein
MELLLKSIFNHNINTIMPMVLYVDQPPSQKQEDCLDKFRLVGGDLDTFIYSAFNGGRDGATSTVGFSSVQPFDLGDSFGFP